MAKGNTTKVEEVKVKTEVNTIKCGLIMPISAIDNCSAEHWNEVKQILTDSIINIDNYQVNVKLVSDADEVGVIQKRIVQNVYDSDIIVCDVSAKNPNVMFELGMRLAFDKPTVIVKDDKTGYSFDTGIIEHIEYPRDLRFSKITSFKEKLAHSVIATYEASLNGGESSSFLKSFGQFNVANLAEETIPADKMIIEMISDLQLDMNRLRRTQQSSRNSIVHRGSEIRHKETPFQNIGKEIDAYMTSNGISSFNRLHNNVEFYNYISGAINASAHFETEKDFYIAFEHWIESHPSYMSF